MPIKIERKVRDNEPAWSEVDKTTLPYQAFAHVGDRAEVSTWSYPYMWIVDGSDPNDNGRYQNGTLYIHKGGLDAAWAAANGARTGKKASAEILSVLEKARKAIGVEEVRKDLTKLRVLKRDPIRRVVVGVVYEPNVLDADGHFARPETIERAAHNYLLRGGVIGAYHDEVSNEEIRKSHKWAPVESYIAPVDIVVNDETIRAGSWMLGAKIFDDEMWNKIERGEISGFSMHGDAWASLPKA